MISADDEFDPILQMIDSQYQLMSDPDGELLLCDDAGSEDLCWGESTNLNDAYITLSDNRQQQAGELDAMITLEIDNTTAGYYFNYLLRSYRRSQGDYSLIFHLGIQAE